jgi:hypothetical protein
MTGYVIWITGAIGAVFVTIWTPWRLALRLFLLVPLIEGAAVVLCANLFGTHGVPLIRLPIDFNFYLLVLFYWAYAVVFHGAWATLLGGLGSIAARSASMPTKGQGKTLVLGGLGAGLMVGVLYDGVVVLSRMSLGGSVPAFGLGWPMIPPLLAGSLGGALVAHYRAKDLLNGDQEEQPV